MKNETAFLILKNNGKSVLPMRWCEVHTVLICFFRNWSTNLATITLWVSPSGWRSAFPSWLSTSSWRSSGFRSISGGTRGTLPRGMKSQEVSKVLNYHTAPVHNVLELEKAFLLHNKSFLLLFFFILRHFTSTLCFGLLLMDTLICYGGLS